VLLTRQRARKGSGGEPRGAPLAYWALIPAAFTSAALEAISLRR
jgi:hypothetical protein